MGEFDHCIFINPQFDLIHLDWTAELLGFAADFIMASGYSILRLNSPRERSSYLHGPCTGLYGSCSGEGICCSSTLTDGPGLDFDLFPDHGPTVEWIEPVRITHELLLRLLPVLASASVLTADLRCGLRNAAGTRIHEVEIAAAALASACFKRPDSAVEVVHCHSSFRCTGILCGAHATQIWGLGSAQNAYISICAGCAGLFTLCQPASARQ